MNFSRWTFWLSFFKSTQILTLPFFFITVTLGAHHSVGSVIGLMMPFLTIRTSSSFTGIRSGSDTRRGDAKLYGTASDFNLIRMGSQFINPKSPKTSSLTSSMSWTIPIVCAALRLSRHVMLSELITHTGNLYRCFLYVVSASNLPTQSILPAGLDSSVEFWANIGLGLIRWYTDSGMQVTSAPVSTLNLIWHELIAKLTCQAAVSLQSIAPRKNDGSSLPSNSSTTSLAPFCRFRRQTDSKWPMPWQLMHFLPFAGQYEGFLCTNPHLVHLGCCWFLDSRGWFLCCLPPRPLPR